MPPKPHPPAGGRPQRPSPAGGRKTIAPANTNASRKAEILKKVTRNCIVNAVVKNKQMVMARNERLGKAKKRKTRKEILAAMDLPELHVERAAMARMGFLDKAEELDIMIEAERARLKKERDQQDQTVLDQKMNGLGISHTRRNAAMDAAQAARIQSLQEKCAAEVEALKESQKKEYNILVSETATRATGGVSSCVCTDPFKCTHNKSASYNTRKPTKDGQRLRASGRLAEADEVDNMAVALEKKAEDEWRKTVEESILASAWCGGKSRLEQMVERQQATMRALLSSHTEKLARLKQQDRLERRNLLSTLAAERKKVILYCRREAIKRRTKDIAASAKEARKMNANKSDGMQNVSKNMFKDSDDSDSEIGSDDERLEGWKPPTASGVDNSKALSSYEDIASGNVHKKLADGTFGLEEGAEAGNGLKTSGSRAMDAYRMKQTGAWATFDPTRGGAKVNMGNFANKPPPGIPSSPALKGPGAAAKGKTKAKGSESSEEEASDESEEGSEEDDEDASDEEGDSDGGGGKKAPAAGSFGGARGPPRGPPTSVAPRGPLASPFPSGGFGGPPGGLPPRAPAPSPFPAGGFGGPPGGLPPTFGGPPASPFGAVSGGIPAASFEPSVSENSSGSAPDNTTTAAKEHENTQGGKEKDEDEDEDNEDEGEDEEEEEEEEEEEPNDTSGGEHSDNEQDHDDPGGSNATVDNNSPTESPANQEDEEESDEEESDDDSGHGGSSSEQESKAAATTQGTSKPGLRSLQPCTVEAAADCGDESNDEEGASETGDAASGKENNGDESEAEELAAMAVTASSEEESGDEASDEDDKEDESEAGEPASTVVTTGGKEESGDEVSDKEHKEEKSEAEEPAPSAVAGNEEESGDETSENEDKRVESKAGRAPPVTTAATEKESGDEANDEEDQEDESEVQPAAPTITTVGEEESGDDEASDEEDKEDESEPVESAPPTVTAGGEEEGGGDETSGKEIDGGDVEEESGGDEASEKEDKEDESEAQVPAEPAVTTGSEEESGGDGASEKEDKEDESEAQEPAEPAVTTSGERESGDDEAGEEDESEVEPAAPAVTAGGEGENGIDGMSDKEDNGDESEVEPSAPAVTTGSKEESGGDEASEKEDKEDESEAQVPAEPAVATGGEGESGGDEASKEDESEVEPAAPAVTAGGDGENGGDEASGQEDKDYESEVQPAAAAITVGGEKESRGNEAIEREDKEDKEDESEPEEPPPPAITTGGEGESGGDEVNEIADKEDDSEAGEPTAPAVTTGDEGESGDEASDKGDKEHKEHKSEPAELAASAITTGGEEERGGSEASDKEDKDDELEVEPLAVIACGEEESGGEGTSGKEDKDDESEAEGPTPPAVIAGDEGESGGDEAGDKEDKEDELEEEAQAPPATSTDGAGESGDEASDKGDKEDKEDESGPREPVRPAVTTGGEEEGEDDEAGDKEDQEDGLEAEEPAPPASTAFGEGENGGDEASHKEDKEDERDAKPAPLAVTAGGEEESGGDEAGEKEDKEDERDAKPAPLAVTAGGEEESGGDEAGEKEDKEDESESGEPAPHATSAGGAGESGDEASEKVDEEDERDVDSAVLSITAGGKEEGGGDEASDDQYKDAKEDESELGLGLDESEPAEPPRSAIIAGGEDPALEKPPDRSDSVSGSEVVLEEGAIPSCPDTVVYAADEVMLASTESTGVDSQRPTAAGELTISDITASEVHTVVPAGEDPPGSLENAHDVQPTPVAVDEVPEVEPSAAILENPSANTTMVLLAGPTDEGLANSDTEPGQPFSATQQTAKEDVPLVGIIHSASSESTTTGEDLAIYLGVCLQLGGYSDVRIIGFGGEKRGSGKAGGGGGGSGGGKFSVVPYGASKPEYPNHAECYRDSWESVSKCNVILICVDPAEAPACASALSSKVEKSSDKAIICFDLGVWNHTAVEEHLNGHDIVLLGGAVGISVARNPVDGHLRCLGSGSLVVERLSKQQSKRGVKFVNLLRTGAIPIRHCKNVTSYAHGVVIFNTVHAAATLAGVPLRDLVRDRYARLLWAAMIHEGIEVLALAARGGDWRAANPCCSLTLPQLELFLCLPTPLFGLVSRWFLRFPPTLAPAMQNDLAGGRDTSAAWTLEEIVRIGEKHKGATPACRAVLSAVKLCVSGGDGVPSTPVEDLPFVSELRSGGSDSTRALHKKLVLWGGLAVLGVTALGLVGGAWVAVGGLSLVVFLCLVKYALVGDVVP
eukprot:g6927.t1